MTESTVPCDGARERLLGFYARSLALEEMMDLVRHLDGCAECARLFTDHGRAFGLVRESFAEHLDAESAMDLALPRGALPLAHPVDVQFLAMGAQHAARLMAAQTAPAARFRGGPAAPPSPTATAAVGPAQLSVSVSGDDPAEVVLRYWGDDTPTNLHAKLRWSDATTTAVDLTRGDATRVTAPAGTWLEVLRLEG